jgi:hypothetical protein
MINHLLIYLSLFSFSVVAHAVTSPVEVNPALSATTQSTVLHKEIVRADAKNDAIGVSANTNIDSCQNNIACSSAIAASNNPQYANNLLAEQESSSALQPLFVLVLIIAILGIFLSRKSISTK